MAEQRHLATLDGLRGVAALSVVALHAFIPVGLSSLTPHATLAVDFFFCLSGFVIAHAYESRLLDGAMSFGDFAAIRLVRLYPLILVGTLAGAALFVAQAVTLHQPLLTPRFLFGLACELLLVPAPAPSGGGWRECPPLDPPAWSLFFELLANFAYAALVVRLTGRVLTALLCASGLILLAYAHAVGGVLGGNYWHNLDGGLVRVGFAFLSGVALCRWVARDAAAARPYLAFGVAAGLLGVLLCPVPPAANWLYESLAVLVAFPLIIAAGAWASPGRRAASVSLFLGRLSYPLYILHFPLVKAFSYFARAHDVRGARLWLLIAMEVSCAVGFSIIVMRLFDEPVRAWLRRRWRAGPKLGVVLRASP